MAFVEDYIIALMRDADERAATLIYENYSKQLYGLAIKMVQDPDAAQEVLQLAFIKIWDKTESYDPSKAQLFTWLYQITRNTALDYLRKNQRKQKKEIQITDRNVYIIDEDVNDESFEHLNTTVSSLDQKIRVVIDAVFYKGMTHVEAADYLNLPLGTLKTRLRNGLKELRTIIKAVVFLLIAPWI